MNPLRPAVAVPPPRARRRWPFVVTIVVASFVAGIGTHAIVNRPPRELAAHPLSWDFLTRPTECPAEVADRSPRDFRDLDGRRVRATCHGTKRGSYAVLRHEGSDRRFDTPDDRCWRASDVLCPSPRYE